MIGPERVKYLMQLHFIGDDVFRNLRHQPNSVYLYHEAQIFKRAYIVEAVRLLVSYNKPQITIGTVPHL